MEQKSGNTLIKVVEGIALPAVFSDDGLRSALTYQPKKGDLFIVTYPKCGTTWMHNIVLLILRHGKISDDPLDFFLGCPFLEMLGSESVDHMLKPGAIKTHLPYHKAPQSKDAKYIYVCRNPKDCAVSYYYHMKAMPIPGIKETNFDDFFELFVKGEVPYGDYFDHIMAWYEHRDDPNVYIITYESLKKDIIGEVLKLAKFIGEEYEKVLLNDPKVLDDVIHYSSFEYMKKDTNETMQKLIKGEVPQCQGSKKLPAHLLKMLENMAKVEQADNIGFQFVRKGIVGDWKNHLNPEQIRRLEERKVEKTANSNVMSLWE